MNAAKIIRLLGLVVAVVAAFVTIPYVAVALAVLGLIVGFFVQKDERLLFLVLVVALATVVGALGGIPTIGAYLTGILTNLSALLTAAAVTVIGMSMYERMSD